MVPSQALSAANADKLEQLETRITALEQAMNIKVSTAPASTKDAGKVRLGGESPSFGPAKK